MSYLKATFLFAILPAIIVIYNIVPKKRQYVLLLANLAFYFLLGKFRLIYLLVSIVLVYFSARIMDKYESEKEKLLKKKDADKKLINNSIKKKKKLILVLCILSNVALLIVFKYLGFFTLNINLLFDLFNINYELKVMKFIAPVGISFYTLSALSYVIDVYNCKIKSTKSIAKVALFLSFFPQIMEGPITRFSDTADDLFAGKKVSYENLALGYQRIMYGFFKKKLIADRLNTLVNTVFSNYASYNGFTIFMGAVGYTVMLYMEFSGTMDVVVGTGQIFGINVPENFRQPFFSKNISEFWTRWHISLGAWFKDYIYYPISLSKPLKKLTLKLRKGLGNHYGPLVSGSIALFVVWFLNGLWHGAGYTFLFFGMYHFVMIVGGNFLGPLFVKLCSLLHINRENIVYRVLQSVKMTLFVFIGEMFFRADTVTQGIEMFKGIVTRFKFSGSELLNLGLDIYDYIVIIAAIIFVFIISLLKEKGVDVRERLNKKKTFIKWAILYAFILSIFIFGAYGPGYEPVDPIYADF